MPRRGSLGEGAGAAADIEQVAHAVERHGGERVLGHQAWLSAMRSRIAAGERWILGPARAEDIGPEARQLGLGLAAQEGDRIGQIAVEHVVMRDHRPRAPARRDQRGAARA